MDTVNLDALREFGDALATADPERVMEATGVDRQVATFMIAVSEGRVSGCTEGPTSIEKDAASRAEPFDRSATG
jgi:hypothetical protein